MISLNTLSNSINYIRIIYNENSIICSVIFKDGY